MSSCTHLHSEDVGLHAGLSPGEAGANHGADGLLELGHIHLGSPGKEKINEMIDDEEE